MTVTLDDFCHRLLDDELFRERLDPERLAAAFTDFFRPLPLAPPWHGTGRPATGRRFRHRVGHDPWTG